MYAILQFNLGFSGSLSSTASPFAYEGGVAGSANDVRNAGKHDNKSSRRSRRRRRRNHKKHSVHIEPEMDAYDKNALSRKPHDAPMTKSELYFALDCEMVGIGPDGFDSAVARVTVVNWENQVVLDTFVRVPVPVTDYRSHISGISPHDLESDDAKTFEEARDAVSTILNGKILIGHGLENDLCALGLTHPWSDIRDTACYGPFMRESVDPLTGALIMRPRKLRDLTWEKLHRQIQELDRAHCPMEDAISALDLYKSVRNEWEQDLIDQREAREAEDRLRGTTKSSSYWQLPLNGSIHGGMGNEGLMAPSIPVRGPYHDLVLYPQTPPPPQQPPSSPSAWFLFYRRGRPKSPPSPSSAMDDASIAAVFADDDMTTVVSSSFSYDAEVEILPPAIEPTALGVESPIPD